MPEERITTWLTEAGWREFLSGVIYLVGEHKRYIKLLEQEYKDSPLLDSLKNMADILHRRTLLLIEAIISDFPQDLKAEFKEKLKEAWKEGRGGQGHIAST